MSSSQTLEFIVSTKCSSIAEIGIGEGHTSLAIARWLNNKGHLHLFDYEDKIQNVLTLVSKSGYNNVSGYGNSRLLLDSYNWSLMKLIKVNKEPIFDYVYIDGSHTWNNDALAYFLCDKLLAPGGYVDFDDYEWRINDSATVAPEVRPRTLICYTEDQRRERHIALIIDLLVSRDKRFLPIVTNRIYQKLA